MIVRSICSFLDIGRQEDFGWNFAICSGHFFTFHYCGNSMGSAASHHVLHQNNCKFSIHSIIISPPPPYQNFFNLENIRYHFHFCKLSIILLKATTERRFGESSFVLQNKAKLRNSTTHGRVVLARVCRDSKSFSFLHIHIGSSKRGFFGVLDRQQSLFPISHYLLVAE